MAIEDLTAVFTLPENPRDTTGDWDGVESSLGIRYPADFRMLIRTYGTGEFLHGLLVYNPLNAWCVREIQKQLKNFRTLRDAMELPIVVHPESSGLFPWGHDVNGNNYCWLTDGPPDRWPVVLLGHNYEDQPLRAEEAVTTFLANYARNKHPEMSGGVRFTKSQRRFVAGLVWEQ